MDATSGRVALGNIGLEWLVPAALLIGLSLVCFWLLEVRALYQVIYFSVLLVWSFVMFSYLHDRMHIAPFWMERNRWTKAWFMAARKRHDVHHRTLNDAGNMNKNFGIGFFLFDRIFGTLAVQQRPLNHRGYEAAKQRYGVDLARGATRPEKA
jgi:sterol desaturase/sphingolipid hydroxylase (fatty acid hydroxylase superfamily)